MLCSGRGTDVFLSHFTAVAHLDQFPGSWKRLGTCSDGVASPRMFPNGKSISLMPGNLLNWYLLNNLLTCFCSSKGDQKSQLRCCIPLDCSISFQGVGITKSGQCKMKTYCPDEFRMTSQGTQERQELYQEFVSLAFSHSGSKKLALMAYSSSLRYGFEDSGCCTTTPVAANSSLEPPQGLNDAENSLRPVLQDLILSSNPVPNYMPPQPPPPTLSPWDAFSSSSDPLAPQSFGVQKISYLPLSTEDSDFLDI